MKKHERSAFQVMSRKLTKLSSRLRLWKTARPPARRLSPLERRRIAYYELGHALVASVLSDAERVGSVSVETRRAPPPLSSDLFITRNELETQLSILLGGRAAEEVAFGQVSTGAAEDIRRATEIAHRMVTVYGMESCLGPVTFVNDANEKRSEQTQREIDECIREILSEALNRAIRVLRINRKILDEAAKLLVEKSKLSESELGEFARRMKPLEPLADASAPRTSFTEGR